MEGDLRSSSSDISDSSENAKPISNGTPKKKENNTIVAGGIDGARDDGGNITSAINNNNNNNIIPTDRPNTPKISKSCT